MLDKRSYIEFLECLAERWPAGYELVRRLQNIAFLFRTAKRGNAKTMYFTVLYFLFMQFFSANLSVQGQMG